MATASSGAFETSVYNAAGSQYPDRIRVEWSSSQSVANNTSTIYWTVKSAGGTGNSYSYVMAGPVTVNIAGVTVFSRSDRFEMHVGATLGSGSFTLTHNTDGTKSFSAWAEAAIYTYAVSSTRYGYSVDLPQIPRASSISSVSGNTMGSQLTINISKASSSFTHTLTWQFGNQTGTIASQTSNPKVTWTPPLSLASQIPNSTSGNGTIWCTTFNGGTNIGQKSINFTLQVPSNIVPSISSFVDSIASTKPANCGLYVKNHSTVQWNVSTKGAYGSTIQKCVISGQNLSYTSTNSSTSYSATSSTLTIAGKKTYTVTVTDSRGRTASATGEITIEDYNPPTITSISSFRSNADGSLNSSGEYVTHQLASSFYTLNGHNNIKIEVYSKKSSDSDSMYANNVIIKNDSSNTASYTYTYSNSSFKADTAYDFKIVISDSVGQSATVYTHVGTKNVPLNIASNNNSVAIGGFAQASKIGRFDCAWEAHFATAPITDSDRNLKHNIKDINIDVIDKLRPVQYNLTNDESDTTHYGFIAQDVEQALLESGVTSDKMGIVYYDKDEKTQERKNYALSYDEIIPLLVKKCQELQREIDKLKGE
ncbi:MAG: DUF859 family phage minor structural protein [Oscillospiraceae bacterium]|nr:DUF859 family phage minor structural protein [Oscillospiraceae bacterium]